MNSKEYKLPNGKIAVFEYDISGVGKITLECMDELMALIADRPRGEWIEAQIRHYPGYECSLCHYGVQPWNNTNYCPNCGARMNSSEKPNNCETCRHKHDGTVGYCRTCGESNYEPKNEPSGEDKEEEDNNEE